MLTGAIKAQLRSFHDRFKTVDLVLFLFTNHQVFSSSYHLVSTERETTEPTLHAVQLLQVMTTPPARSLHIKAGLPATNPGLHSQKLNITNRVEKKTIINYVIPYTINTRIKTAKFGTAVDPSQDFLYQY